MRSLALIKVVGGVGGRRREPRWWCEGAVRRPGEEPISGDSRFLRAAQRQLEGPELLAASSLSPLGTPRRSPAQTAPSFCMDPSANMSRA